jgi:hypothetical protein
MTILEHLDARARRADAFELADETHCGFPGPPAATSTSRSTRLDGVHQCVNDKAGAGGPRRPSRGGWNVSMPAVALDLYMG